MASSNPVTQPIPSLELLLDPEKIGGPDDNAAGKVVDVIVYDWKPNQGESKAIRLFSREAGNQDRAVVSFIEPDTDQFVFCQYLAAKQINKFHLRVKLIAKREYTSKKGQQKSNWVADVLPLAGQHSDVFGFFKASPEELQERVEQIKEVIARNAIAQEKAAFKASGSTKPTEVKPVEVVDDKTPASMKQVEKKSVDEIKSPKLKTSIMFDSPEQAVACYRGVQDIRDFYPKMPQGRILAMAAFLGMKQLKQHFDVTC